MIISPRHGFVFVHVPKCAGTSVRTQIATCDSAHVALAQTGMHPVLGHIDYGHIPLSQLREHFPTHYDYLERLDAFAVIRDPLSRFGSSLRQLLWQYEKTPMTMIPPNVLRERVLEVIGRVEDEIDAPSAPMIFFAQDLGPNSRKVTIARSRVFNGFTDLNQPTKSTSSNSIACYLREGMPSDLIHPSIRC